MTEDKQPICPYCEEEMFEGRIQMADGSWQKVWLCGCVDPAERTERYDVVLEVPKCE